MSLKYFSSGSIPAQTARIARAAFPKGNVYLNLRDEFGTIYDDADFESLFPPRGHPAESPVRLALIVVFQFLEGLSDRAAADAVRSRIDWKYALGLELEDAGFDASVLTGFRARLIEDCSAQLLFDKLLAKLKAVGLVKAKGTQRTDSTRVLAAVHDYNRLGCVWKTVRVDLNVLAQSVPEWLAQQVKPEWFERYNPPPAGYKMPETKRQRYLSQAGRTEAHCSMPLILPIPVSFGYLMCRKLKCCGGFGDNNFIRKARHSKSVKRAINRPHP